MEEKYCYVINTESCRLKNTSVMKEMSCINPEERIRGDFPLAAVSVVQEMKFISRRNESQQRVTLNPLWSNCQCLITGHRGRSLSTPASYPREAQYLNLGTEADS